jgi:enoyl-CoA hydratase/carnithine racemase
MSDRVVVTRLPGGVADVRLNRADKMNALDIPMFEALVAAGTELASDRTLRAVVLSGEGRAFSAGLDFSSFQSMAGGSRSGGGPAPPNLLSRGDASSPANFAQRAAWIWTEVPVPVIAAVHGVAYGGGLQIALGADLRFVAPDAKLSVMEIKWGLVPDMSGTQTLRRLVRLDVAKELTFTGRVISGTEAVELGLATRVAADPRAAALEAAAEIAAKSPDAIRAAKKLLDASGVVPVADGLRLEEQLQIGLIGRGNQIESVRANLEKRAPRFEDPS